METRLRIDFAPPPQDTIAESNAPGYDVILSKFHNPFEVVELFKKHHFEDIRLLWYHYRPPAMPYLEEQLPELFRRRTGSPEHEPRIWRGYFLCSAFVVEAVKNGDKRMGAFHLSKNQADASLDMADAPCGWRSRLFPICRSLTGNGVRQTLNIS